MATALPHSLELIQVMEPPVVECSELTGPTLLEVVHLLPPLHALLINETSATRGGHSQGCCKMDCLGQLTKGSRDLTIPEAVLDIAAARFLPHTHKLLPLTMNLP